MKNCRRPKTISQCPWDPSMASTFLLIEIHMHYQLVQSLWRIRYNSALPGKSFRLNDNNNRQPTLLHCRALNGCGMESVGVTADVMAHLYNMRNGPSSSQGMFVMKLNLFCPDLFLYLCNGIRSPFGHHQRNGKEEPACSVNCSVYLYWPNGSSASENRHGRNG